MERDNHQHINTSTHQHINTSTHQHINTSTHQHINMFQPTRFTAGLLWRQHTSLCILGHWFWLHVSLSHAWTPTLLMATYIDHVRKTDIEMKSLFSAMFVKLCYIGSHSKDWSMGNWLRFIWKVKTFSDGMRGILGMNILFPICGSHTMTALMTCWCRCWMMCLVPLQWPFVMSRLRTSMTMLFSFKLSLWGDIPEGHRELINSRILVLILFDRVAALEYFLFSGKKTHKYVVYSVYLCVGWTRMMQRDASHSGSVPKLELLKTKLSKSRSFITVIS